MKYQLSVYTRAACTFVEREFAETRILECVIFLLTTAGLLNSKIQLY